MPGKTTLAGYGYAHQQRRKRLAVKIARGGVACARCGREIPPPGSGRRCPGLLVGGVCGKVGCGWDLGHDDHDRTKYRGPEHHCCNVGAPKRGKTVSGPPPAPERSGRW